MDDAARTEEYDPAMQLMQALLDVAEMALDHAPALQPAHAWTDVAPIEDGHVPVRQVMQADAPNIDDHVPAAQF